MGLVQAAIERRGIATASVSLLRSVTEKVGPPRALAVPFAHGRPLGAAGDRATQRRVLLALLRLVAEARGPGPVLVDLDEMDVPGAAPA
ncbi:hypothetical protein [Haliangium ochraceum]|uniref:Uncharacterized protein n=1 Tax=Haliangium ochraceum (strain DSM 14365 / JCM 11303 / SMP-2) TaxID=502025 RepID=D0LFS7_HALO1|nr:hypothetical protein [Haliangium ochraceum]ACY14529.1 conserved hypothetical protein [Haliangium ochraceum DSM 14365]